MSENKHEREEEAPVSMAKVKRRSRCNQTKRPKRKRSHMKKIPIPAMPRDGKRVLVVHPQGMREYLEIPVENFDLKLDFMQKCVGGNVQMLPCNQSVTGDVWAYVNEDGIRMGLPENRIGTTFLQRAKFPVERCLRGSILIVGWDDKALSATEMGRLDTLLTTVITEMAWIQP
jgi:hypothetical protein